MFYKYLLHCFICRKYFLVLLKLHFNIKVLCFKSDADMDPRDAVVRILSFHKIK